MVSADASEKNIATASVHAAEQGLTIDYRTTTAEALWMGVPTVTLSSKTLVGRQGESMLRCVGLGDWVATTTQDYVRIALEKVADLAAAQRLIPSSLALMRVGNQMYLVASATRWVPQSQTYKAPELAYPKYKFLWRLKTR